LSWQNNRELQLGPNKTFKSKLWKFDDTIQVCNNTNENELLISSIDLKSTIEQTIKTTTTQTLNEKRKVIGKFKYLASNFALFQKEFFENGEEDLDQIELIRENISKQQELNNNNADDDDDDDNYDDDEDDDDDKIEDGIINYDEENEILMDKSRSHNLNQQQSLTTVVADSYDCSYQQQSSNYVTDLNAANNKKSRYDYHETNFNGAQNYYDISTHNQQDTYDSNKKYYENNNQQQIYNSNQENYDYNNSYNNYSTTSTTTSASNRSPYCLASLQNSAYMIDTTTSAKYLPINQMESMNEYQNMMTMHNNNNNNIGYNYYETNSPSTCSYYNMTTLAENNNQLNLNDFSFNYQSY